MAATRIEQRDEFGPTVSVGRFVAVLAALMLCGHGLLEFERVTLSRDWGQSFLFVPWIRSGLSSGLSIGAAAACVAFGRVRLDLSHRALAWFALILVGPLASLVGVDLVAMATGALPAPALDAFASRWATVAIRWSLVAAAVAVGLILQPRNPTRRQRALYAVGATVLVSVIAIVEREFELAWFTRSMRYACVVPLLVRSAPRALPGALVLATVALVVSGAFAHPAAYGSGMTDAWLESPAAWVGAALPLLLARRYERIAETRQPPAGDSRALRPRVGAVLALLLVGSLTVVCVREPPSRPLSPETMPDSLWLELDRTMDTVEFPIAPDEVDAWWWPQLSPDGPPLSPVPVLSTMTGFLLTRDEPRPDRRESNRIVYRIKRAHRPSGPAALLPRTLRHEVVGRYVSTDQVEERVRHLAGGGPTVCRWLRFDRRPLTEPDGD